MTSDLDIFRYENYRDYLGDYYLEQKKKYPDKFSHRYFAKQAGFKTSNFLQLLIKGKRNLGLDSLKKIADFLNLRGRRLDYFETLVQFNQSENNIEKSRYFEKLVSFREYQDVRLVTESETVYFSKWFYPVVREMLKLRDFNGDPAWVSRHIHPRISEEEAKEALTILQTLQLIEKTSDNQWIQKDAQLTTTKQRVRHEVISFHKKMIQFGYESLNRPGTERDVSGITMSLSPAKFELIRQRIEEFRDDVQQIITKPLTLEQIREVTAESPNSDQDASQISQVCQLNIQFFKLATSTIPRRKK